MFEVITKEASPFESLGGTPLESVSVSVEGKDTAVPPENLSRAGMIWCEFCKGHYYEEYHYGEKGGE